MAYRKDLEVYYVRIVTVTAFCVDESNLKKEAAERGRVT